MFSYCKSTTVCRIVEKEKIPDPSGSFRPKVGSQPQLTYRPEHVAPNIKMPSHHWRS